MNTEEISKINKKFTEEERLELAAKLDADLDAFINGLEKKRYEEGWPEDRWQEEMDKHPFFMKKAPQPGDDVHPMFEGLQKLKYDPEENTKEELALNYKEDGNFYMKHKKFRMAVYSFTEAIKTECENPQVKAILYNNRSAAQFFLENYRSALNDAQTALELKPDYVKARWRAANCAYRLERFDLCAEMCEIILNDDINNVEAKNLLQKNKTKKLETERDLRKETAATRKRLTRFQKLCEVLKNREIKFDDLGKDKLITEEFLRPKFAPLENFPVHLLENDNNLTLIWPAGFSYPEFLFTDFQQQLSEVTVMEDCVNSMFVEPLDCDKTKSYYAGNLSVYYENRRVGCIHKVDLKKTVREIIEEKSFFVTGGSLLFYIVPKNSKIEQEFIHKKRRPMVYS